MTKVDPQGWTGAAIPGVSVPAAVCSGDEHCEALRGLSVLFHTMAEQ